MAVTVSISEAAEADVREAFLWYEEQKTGLGEVFRSVGDTGEVWQHENSISSQVPIRDPFCDAGWYSPDRSRFPHFHESRAVEAPMKDVLVEKRQIDQVMLS